VLSSHWCVSVHHVCALCVCACVYVCVRVCVRVCVCGFVLGGLFCHQMVDGGGGEEALSLLALFSRVCECECACACPCVCVHARVCVCV